MSASRFTPKGGVLLGWLRFRPQLAGVAAVVVFLWCVAQFYQSGTGFSSLITIGDVLNGTKVTALRQVPHYVYEQTAGYDGAYYVQLALYPTLDNPELTKAIDNLPYRAKRILFCWVAWVAGLGQPAWVVQAHALLNVGCWLALAGVLLRWFPLNSWANFLRWAAVLFSHGLCMSVRNSLVDGPSLLLVALALRWLEDGRKTAGAVTLALAGLGKETNLLACAGVDWDWRAPRTWWRVALTMAGIALPLVAWMAFVRWKFGPAEDPGMGNFTLPFAGFVEKVLSATREVVGPEASPLAWATLASVAALAVQWGFLMFRWRPADRWWRVGATFALMTVFLSTPVWEGYPGAATRVLLPMTLAFNILVPGGRRWLPLLLAGNFSVAATVFEFSPPSDFYLLQGDDQLRSAVRVSPAQGWHAPEQRGARNWRWSSGSAELHLVNESGGPVRITVRGQVSAVDGVRSLRVSVGERLLWGDELTRRPEEIRFGLTLPPGATVLAFTTNLPPQKFGSDPRNLAFRVENLEVVVEPAGVAR